MRIASIDPGKTGALVLIVDGVPTDFSSMLMQPKGKLVDAVKVASLLWAWNIDQIVLEQVGSSPQQGVSSAFNFGANYMVIQGIAAGIEVRCNLVRPVKWKTYHGLIKKPKDAARLKMIELFPDLAKEFKLKKSVDKADACLMGLAWWETEGKKR